MLHRTFPNRRLRRAIRRRAKFTNDPQQFLAETPRIRWLYTAWRVRVDRPANH